MRIYKAKAPMRIGFFGGGTDVSPYAEEHGGKVLNCTIDKYVRCMLRANGEEGVTIRSLDLESVSRNMTGRWEGRLALPQAVLDAMPEARGVEVTMFSDVPPGSGLGSSSALVVSMLKLIGAAYDLPADPYVLAELAYRIERVDLGIPGGRQDQYAAAFGGMCLYHFGGERVIVEPVLSDPTALFELESCLLIGYIGDRRLLTHHLVEDQVRRLKEGDTLRYHDETKAFVDESRRRSSRRSTRWRGSTARGAARSPARAAAASWSSPVRSTGGSNWSACSARRGCRCGRSRSPPRVCMHGASRSRRRDSRRKPRQQPAFSIRQQDAIAPNCLLLSVQVASEYEKLFDRDCLLAEPLGVGAGADCVRLRRSGRGAARPALADSGRSRHYRRAPAGDAPAGCAAGDRHTAGRIASPAQPDRPGGAVRVPLAGVSARQYADLAGRVARAARGRGWAK